MATDLYSTELMVTVNTTVHATECPPAGNFSMIPDQYGADFYGYIVFCGPLCCLGFVLNLLCVAVLGRDKSKVSTSFFLKGLALADNGLLVVVFFTKTLSTAGIYYDNVVIDGYYEFFNKSIAFTNAAYEIVKMYAVLMVVLVTIDRSIAVYFPLQANRLCTAQIAVIEVLGLGLYAIAFNMPRFFEFEYVEEWNNCTNGTVASIRPTSLILDNTIYNAVYNNLDSAANLIIPVILVTILNIGLVHRVTMARKSRMQMATNQRGGGSNTSITLNLVGVVTAFVVCETPIAIITIMTGFDMNFDKMTAHICADCLQTFGSFINFFIYCLTGRKFRKILMEEVCCGKKMKRTRMSSWNRMGASTSKYSKDSVMTVSVTNF